MQIWSQGETEFNRYWFPSYDTPNDFRTTELKATVDKKYSVISNGALVEDKDNGDGTHTVYWKMDTPYTNYLTSIVVGEYAEVKTANMQGIPVYAYGYKNETKEVAATTKNIVDMMKFFSEKTGVKYPYPKYAQTMVEDFGGGMENISATTHDRGNDSRRARTSRNRQRRTSGARTRAPMVRRLCDDARLGTNLAQRIVCDIFRRALSGKK